ncbi:MAG: aspartate-semialdehyde dehydrogenase [Thermacetogeniaceae bacterium]
MAAGYRVAVVGATGAVGQEILLILKERGFPVAELTVLADESWDGKQISFGDEQLTVHTAVPESFRGIEIAFFATSGPVSEVLVPEAVKRGAIVIDNSSTFRLKPDVPLVVPEVNPQDVAWHKGIIANPNCSTILFVVPIKPLHDAAHIRRAVVSTYQAVSGAGREAIDELLLQTRQVVDGEAINPRIFPYQIAFNLIPHIDVFEENGYSREEMKMVWETQKILHDPEIRISATAVRVPVFRSHSESVNIETERKLTPDEARRLLAQAPGVVVQDDPASLLYPLPLMASNHDEVFVGRIREDLSSELGLNLWLAGDQLRKGAATNAVQIAELLAGRS